MTHSAVPSGDPLTPLDAEVQLVWPDDVGANAVAANQVLVSSDQAFTDVIYLYLGHIAPPPWLTPEIAQERLAVLKHKLNVEPKGSFMLSRSRAEELWTALGRHLGKLPNE